MSQLPGIGFIGFGEAGYHLAKGLKTTGECRLAAYDINWQTSGLGEQIRERARETTTHLVASPADLASRNDLLLSVVTAQSAVEAASQTAPFLEARHYFADLNSVSPQTKRAIAKIITDTPARFVEAAVMAPVPPYGHRVPMLLGGEHASAFASALEPAGMRLEVIAEPIGTAAAIKMCRSIVVKGLEAILLECALAANLHGADERVFASLDESFPGIDWQKLATYMIGRIAEHGERRAHEMEEVADMLRSSGIDPIMSEATARRQAWGAELNLLEHFAGAIPDKYEDLIRAIRPISDDSCAHKSEL
jgi:3-hydroxyisobutyrate dehydrogenase-like beta-hydroxyacid dehydrogenase